MRRLSAALIKNYVILIQGIIILRLTVFDTETYKLVFKKRVLIIQCTFNLEDTQFYELLNQLKKVEVFDEYSLYDYMLYCLPKN